MLVAAHDPSTSHSHSFETELWRSDRTDLVNSDGILFTLPTPKDGRRYAMDLAPCLESVGWFPFDLPDDQGITGMKMHHFETFQSAREAILRASIYLRFYGHKRLW